MIYCNEIYKLLHQKMFILVAVCAVLLNIYISCSQNFGMYCPAKEYKEYYALAEGKTFEQAYDYSVARRDNMFGGWEAGKWEVRQMMNNEIEQLKAVGTYHQYLQSIDDAAATMTSVSIFADPDGFAYRNIVKTPAAYDGVRSVQPVFAPSYGVLLAIENTPSDILLLFVIFTAVTVIFYKDRECGIVGLVKPLRYGRTRLALSKTVAVFTVCLVCGGCFFLLNMWIGSVRFGLGDLSRPAQSLKGFLGCNLRISVRQLMILIFVYKILAMFICALIAQSLFIRFKNTTSYFILLLAGGVETALYLIISETSVLSPIKQINLTAFVNSAHLFKTYANINLFGFPINLLITTTAVSVIFIALLIILMVRLYENISISEIKKARRKLIKIKPPKLLFAYSMHKLFILHKGLLILAAVLAFSLYSEYNYVRPYSSSDNYYRAYAAEAYSKQSPAEVYEYMHAAADELAEGYKAAMSGGLTDNEYWSKRSGFEKLVNQYNNAVNLSARDVSKFLYYTTGWEELFGVNGFRTDYKLGLVAILGIGLAISPLIAYDNRARIGFLLYTTKAGKRTYFEHNAAVAAIFTLMTCLAVYVPHYVEMILTYGSQGLFEPVSAISAYAKLGGLPVLGYLILLTVFCIISLTVFAEVVLLISYKCKSQTTATVIALAAFALPIVIYLAGADFMQWLCWRVSGNREIFKLLI